MIFSIVYFFILLELLVSFKNNKYNCLRVILIFIMIEFVTTEFVKKNSCKTVNLLYFTDAFNYVRVLNTSLKFLASRN